MKSDDLMPRLLEIQEDFCPSDVEEIKRQMDEGNYDLCGCSICSLVRDLIVEEVQSEVPNMGR